MDRQQTEEINNVTKIGFYDMQRLLLQGYCFDENPKPVVISSLETGGKWLANANWQASAGYHENFEPAAEEMFCGKSMETEGTAAPLSEAGRDVGAIIAEGNMIIQDYLGLVNTESSKNSDFFSSGNGAGVSNGTSQLMNLHGGQQLSTGIQHFDNIACGNPNVPLAAQEYWEHGYSKVDLNHITNYLAGCCSSPQGSLTLPIHYQTNLDFPSAYQRQLEGTSRNQLRDFHVSTDQQKRPFSKYPALNHCSFSHSEFSSMGMLRSSKYLKPAQQLLEEVCSVKSTSCRKDWPAIEAAMQLHSKTSSDDPHLHKRKAAGPSKLRKQQAAESIKAAGREVDRVHLQMKKARLICMVEELDRGYQQYMEQMQLIIISFESATGIDAAAPYTAIAKKYISRQFRALRDAIEEHIHDSCQMLGEDISSVPILNKGETPRLRILDQRLRHHRTLQQVGMVPQAWRPQRGLPERSVAVLRAWLFEHFLHPYPKDSEKLMLARLAGLTRSQVTNWFINARVRLWKPMVEQMYIEEKKEALESQSKAGADRPQYAQTRFTEYRSDCDVKGNNVMDLSTRENPPKRHRYEHLVHGECNTRTPHSSSMTKHGVSLTLALQHSDELAPSTYKSNQHFILHPVSGNAVGYNIADVFS